jgi:hypothetical protein
MKILLYGVLGFIFYRLITRPAHVHKETHIHIFPKKDKVVAKKTTSKTGDYTDFEEVKD